MKPKVPLEQNPMKRRAVKSVACLLAAAIVACSEGPSPAGALQAGTVTGRAGDRILTFHSAHHGEVQVADRGRERSLNFVGGGMVSNQSRIDLDDPHRLLFEYTRCSLLGIALFPAPRRQVRSVLMIGLGAGSLLRFIRKHHPDAAIDTVELDPLIVELSRKYFFVTEADRVMIHVGDGRAFVEKGGRSYDLAIIDAFNADNSVPSQLTSLEFLRCLRARLNGGGVVVTNFIDRDDGIYRSILATYLRSFRHVMRCDLGRFGRSNVVIIATDDPAKRLEGAGLARRVAAYSAGLGERYDLLKYVEACGAVTPDDAAAPVIRDR
ncbi:MAG: fused MFS/spermidine synthase [Spirochaetes bacterium]|nr:fused MFS/spermidine synthase [Spirochaetota bacterium]